MTFKKFALVFCILCPVIVCSCTIGNTWLSYTFKNESSFTIQITLSEPYKYETSSETSSDTPSETFTSPFLVYISNVKKVSVLSDGNVYFQWTTTSSAIDNSKVYCVTNGSKATFKDR
jgi:hypothetical protein